MSVQMQSIVRSTATVSILLEVISVNAMRDIWQMELLV